MVGLLVRDCVVVAPSSEVLAKEEGRFYVLTLTFSVPLNGHLWIFMYIMYIFSYKRIKTYTCSYLNPRLTFGCKLQ
jgi:hypothetical protein